MSQTRSEVLSLLKQFDQEFTVFQGVEESFILALSQALRISLHAAPFS